MRNLRYYIPGALMLMAGILILAVPEVLVVFAAASVTMIGFFFLYFGHRMSKVRAEWRDLNQATMYARVLRNPPGAQVPYWF